MVDILHRVGIKSDAGAVYGALATCDGLARWWTNDTTGDSKTGGIVNFRFGDRGFIAMKVLELRPDRRVTWEVVGGPSDWIGTEVSFELKPDDIGTTLLFRHAGWKEPVEFMHHCSTKWATFLMSLKSVLETGEGAAFPNDIHVSNDGD